MSKQKKPRKKFKETKVGIFLKEKGPKILDTIGDVLPNNGVYGVVKNLISQDDEMDPADKDLALKMIDQDIAEMDSVSERWQYDMQSDSWLSKNTRPLALVFLTASAVFMMAVDSFHLQFQVDDAWINLLKTLLVTVYVAYFGSRGAEKITKINK